MFPLFIGSLPFLGGRRLENLRLVQEGNIRITPDIFVESAGGEHGITDALFATKLRQQT